MRGSGSLYQRGFKHRGVGVQRRVSRDPEAREWAAQIRVLIRQVEPSGANSPQTLDLSALISARETQADAPGLNRAAGPSLFTGQRVGETEA